MSSVHSSSPPPGSVAQPGVVSPTKAGQDQEQHLSHALINTLVVLLKTAYIHKQNNAALHRPLASMQETTSALFHYTDDDVVTLRLASNTFFLNQTPVKLDQSSFQNVEFLRIICDELGIGAFEFHKGCEEKTFRELMVSVVQAVRAGPAPEAHLKRDLGTIHLKPPVASAADKTLLDRRQFILQSYALALVSTSRTLAHWRQGKRPRLSRVKRTVQNLLDIVDEDAITLLGLTQLRAYRRHLASHFVHVAILSLVIGQRAGLSKSELVRLGMTGLWHELGAMDLPEELCERIDTLDEAAKEELGKLPLLSVRRLMEFPKVEPDDIALVASIFENRAHIPSTHSYHVRLATDVMAQIVAVADAYDHLTTSRMGNSALRPDQALGVLLRNREGKFADWAVKLLAGAIGRYPIGTLVELDTGERGIVSDRPEESTPASRPKIRLVAAPDGTPIPTSTVVDLCETNASGHPVRSIRRTLDPDLAFVNIPHFFLD